MSLNHRLAVKMCTFPHRLTLADVSVFGVARYSTRSSVFAWSVLATVEHSFTALAYKYIKNTFKLNFQKKKKHIHPQNAINK